MLTIFIKHILSEQFHAETAKWVSIRKEINVGKKDTKTEFEIWTLEILWEERHDLVQKMSFPLCLGVREGWGGQ